MKYITNQYIDNKFTYDLQKKDIKLLRSEYTNFTPTLINEEQKIIRTKLFTDKYHALISAITYTHTDSNTFIEFAEYVKNNKISILNYKNISNSFVDDYIMIFDNADIFNGKKNILLFNTAVNLSEALLYYNTILNKFKSVNYYIENLWYINEGDISLYKKYFDLLQKYYEGENIIIELGEDLPYPSHSSNEYCKRYSDKKIDLIVLDTRRFMKESGKIHEKNYNILHFAVMFIMLKILDKNGVFVFHNDMYPFYYMKQIMYILAKYFQSIRIYKNKIRDRNYFICEKFVGSDKVNPVDIKLFEKILLEWDSIEVNGGNLVEKYYVSKLSTFQENEIIENYLREYYLFLEHQSKKYVKIYHTYLTADFTTTTLINFYKDAVQQDYYNIITLCHKYKLALSESYIQKYGQEPESLMNLFVYRPIQYMGFTTTQLFENPNDSIGFSEDVVLLNKLMESVSYLNLHKIGIDSKNIDVWSKITYDANISNYLTKYIENMYGIKITRGFVKMHEMLHTFKLINSSLNNLTSLHLCEAPGHFINSVSHFINSRYPHINHKWYGNSLNPYNQSNQEKYGKVFSDDYGFIKNYPDQWLWGADDTGDITKDVNIQFFKDNYAKSVDLITSDCGMGQETRAEYFLQEITMSKANFSQILISLIVLKLGGSGVFKYFIPFTKPLTVSVIYLLSRFFEQVYIVKPVNSSPTNNEIYFVAINKLYDLSEKNYDLFKNFLNNFDTETYLFKEIDDMFMKQLNDIIYRLVNSQIDQLKTVYYLYDNLDYWENLRRTSIRISQKNFANKWTYLNNFEDLQKNNFLSYHQK